MVPPERHVHGYLNVLCHRMEYQVPSHVDAIMIGSLIEMPRSFRIVLSHMTSHAAKNMLGDRSLRMGREKNSADEQTRPSRMIQTR